MYVKKSVFTTKRFCFQMVQSAEIKFRNWFTPIFQQKEIESANVFIFASSHLQIHKQKIHNIDINCFKILNYNRILGVNQFRNFISADCTISKQKRLAVKSVLCATYENISLFWGTWLAESARARPGFSLPS